VHIASLELNLLLTFRLELITTTFGHFVPEGMFLQQLVAKLNKIPILQRVLHICCLHTFFLLPYCTTDRLENI